jgi:hypothetical protein
MTVTMNGSRKIAQEQGTNGAALIRKAVKDIIKAAYTP